MTLQEVIKHYIPDLKKAELQETIGGFHFFKIHRQNDNEAYQSMCLYEIDDYTPDPLEPIDGIEDSFGLPVEGCFVVGTGEVIAIDELEKSPTTRMRRDFYFYDKAGQPYPESGQGYLLYALSKFYPSET